MAYTNEVVFLLVGLITLGMTVHAWSLYGGSSEARPERFLLAAFLLADVSCLSTLLVTVLSPVFLTLTNSGLLATIWCVALTARSWRKPLTRRLIFSTGALMLLVPVIFEFMRQNNTYVQRVVVYTFLSAVLMIWVLCEVFLRQKEDKSFQLKFMMGVVISSLALRVGRMVFVLQQTTQPQTLLQELPVPAMLRNASVSMDVLVLSSMLAYSTYLLALRYQKSAEDNREVREAHQKLQAVLMEKDQMLKALTTSTKSRNMGVLLGSLAHELSQPLTTMRLKVEYLVGQPQLSDADRQDFLAELLQDNERAVGIVTQLRSFLRHGSTHLQRVSLNRVLSDALDVMTPELERLSVHLKCELDADVEVKAVEGQLQMVVLNLLKNALDAVKEVPAPRRMHVMLSSSGEQVTLTVSDNGLGVPRAQWDRVFDMFYSTKTEGMGLGLWLSRSIIQSQGGTMTVSNSTLGGACFTLTWPRQIPAA